MQIIFRRALMASACQPVFIPNDKESGEATLSRNCIVKKCSWPKLSGFKHATNFPHIMLNQIVYYILPTNVMIRSRHSF